MASEARSNFWENLTVLVQPDINAVPIVTLFLLRCLELQLLLYQLTGAPRYKTAITNFLESWQPGNIHYTPKGLAWRDQWGTNRYAGKSKWTISNTKLKTQIPSYYSANEVRPNHFTKNLIVSL